MLVVIILVFKDGVGMQIFYKLKIYMTIAAHMANQIFHSNNGEMQNLFIYHSPNASDHPLQVKCKTSNNHSP